MNLGQEIKNRFFNDCYLKFCSLEVTTLDQCITLTGVVPTWFQKQMATTVAEEIIKAASVVINVKNEIQVVPNK